MQFQLIIGSVVIVLIVLFVYLKRTKGHQESSLPVVSEDVNLPTVNQPNPPMVSQSESPVQNESRTK